MRRLKSFIFIWSCLLLSLSNVKSATLRDNDRALSSEGTTNVHEEASPNPVRSLADEYAESRRRVEENFKEWFSENLQRIKTNPNSYLQTQIAIPSEESKKSARSYVHRVTGKYQYNCTRVICAVALICSLYSHYSQSCALPMITQGNYSHNIGESANCKITPDVFPVLYAIAGGSVIGAFNSGLNYYNTNWLNAKPYAFLVGAYVITTLVYNFDTHKLVAPVVYPICGGLTLSCLFDLIKIFFTIPPKPNPIKKISTDSVAVDNAIDLIARLIEYMEFSKNEDITDHLYAN